MKPITKLILAILALGALMTFTSCEKVKEIIQSKIAEVPKEELLKIFEKQKEFIEEHGKDLPDTKKKQALEVIQKVLENYKEKADALEKEGGKIGCISMEYTTVDAKGKNITLSGKIYVPYVGNNTIMPIKDIVVNHFGTCTQGKGLLSLIVPYLYTYKYLAADHYAVFEPEYIGFGVTSDKLQTYLCQNLIAQNCYDMVIAGIKLLKNDYKATFDTGYGTYITGYSQGGGNAMALARHMTIKANQGDRSLYNLKRTICGDGPYDPAKTFSTWIEKDGMVMSMILPMVLYGVNEVYGYLSNDDQGYFYSDYWTSGIPTKVKNLEYPYNDSYDYDVQHKKEGGTSGLLGPEVQITLIASSEALTTGKAQYNNLMKSLSSEIVCNDWTPDVRLTIFCDVNDDVVPYINSKSAYDSLYPKATTLVDSVQCNTGDHILTFLKYNKYINDLLSE